MGRREREQVRSIMTGTWPVQYISPMTLVIAEESLGASRLIGLRSCLACRRVKSAADFTGHVCHYPSPSKHILRRELGARDGWLCRICHWPISPSHRGNDPWAASIDHRQPRAAGGRHALTNLQLAHRLCNSIRSNAPLADLSPADFRQRLDMVCQQLAISRPAEFC